MLQADDIWSLGCILSEALVWSLYGMPGLFTYRYQRRCAKKKVSELSATDDFHNGNERLEDAILTRENLQLRDLGRDTSHRAEQIVDLIEEMLRADPALRPSAGSVLRRLQQVCLSNDSPFGLVANHGPFLGGNLSQQLRQDYQLLQSCEIALTKLTLSQPEILHILTYMLKSFFSDYERGEPTSPNAVMAAKKMSAWSKDQAMFREVVLSLWHQIFPDHVRDGPPVHVTGRYWSDVQVRLGSQALTRKTWHEDLLSGDDNKFWYSALWDPTEGGAMPFYAFDLSLAESAAVTCSSSFKLLRSHLERFSRPSIGMLLCRYRFADDRNEVFSTAFRCRWVLKQLQTANFAGSTGFDAEKLRFSDLVKCGVEDLFQEQWDWWPLSPREREVKPGSVRLHWVCVCFTIFLSLPASTRTNALQGCGDMRTANVPEQFAKDAIRAFVILDSAQRVQANEMNVSLQHAGAWRLSKPLQEIQEPAIPGPSVGGPLFLQTQISSSSVRIADVSLLVSDDSNVQHKDSLAQLEIALSRMDTAQFLKRLRQEYRYKEGLFRVLFGLNTFSHCDFYKVKSMSTMT